MIIPLVSSDKLTPQRNSELTNETTLPNETREYRWGVKRSETGGMEPTVRPADRR